MPGPRAARTQPLLGRHILVVDDDADIRRMVATVLAGAGARVAHASTAEAAARVLDDTPDLSAVVLDWNLAGSSASALIEQSRSHAQLAGRIVVITGDLVRRDTTHPAERLGLVVLQKPFRPRSLVDLLYRLLKTPER